ncbi:hypothetical protein BIY24_12530 [Halobacteriovorax marinus]|nr:hypothetical protein [Halobacteriovorax marinus]ATH08743.1 hypothetical protein BIY24_12530 [Halobacteriovorax marinus]
MSEHLEQFFKIKSNELYPFAYSLLPDDLQAGQLVLDAIDLILVDRDFSSKFPEYFESEDELRRDLGVLSTTLYSHIYRLAKRRVGQLSGSFTIPRNFGPFYRTPIESRGVIFLREKLSFSWERISEITGKSRIEAIEKYHLGVNSVYEYLGKPTEVN